jgi:hypothetical protein
MKPELADAVQRLVNALPSCEMCGTPATRIGDDGMYRDDLKLCDTCEPDEFEGLWDECCTWAEPLREVMSLLAKEQDEQA